MTEYKKLRKEIVDMVENKLILLNEFEAMIVYQAVISTNLIPGDIVEIGTYKGGSAKLICQAKGDRLLHLFDTWEGVVNIDKNDELSSTKFFSGRYKTDIDSVKTLLSGYPNVLFYKGVFPETYTGNIQKVSMINLDVDLYEPTKSALELFWDKLSIGGIIVAHDYPTFEGVRIAIDEFLSDKKFVNIKTLEDQSLIIKMQ
jgi:hypothetical protein